MAIDTADKRRAAVAPCFGYYNPGVTPSSTHDGLWRQRVGHSLGALAGPSQSVVEVHVRVRGRMQLSRADGRALTSRSGSNGRTVR